MKSATLCFAAIISTAPFTALAQSEAVPQQEDLTAAVEVSLGREEVKREVAKELGITETEVPLSVELPMDVAEKACPQQQFETTLKENRSCTASEFIPELSEAARQSITSPVGSNR